MSSSTPSRPRPRRTEINAVQGRGPRRRRLLTVVTSFLALVIAGVAFAAWVATGTGSGEVQAGAAQSLGVTLSASPDDRLFPTTSSNVTVEVDRGDNPFDVTVTSITLNETNGITATGDCSGDDVTWSGDRTFTRGEHVTEGEEAIDIVLENAITMHGEADNGCQNATFTITVDVVAEAYEAAD